jgi:predicted O-methyltransferase YrrM
MKKFTQTYAGALNPDEINPDPIGIAGLFFRNVFEDDSKSFEVVTMSQPQKNRPQITLDFLLNKIKGLKNAKVVEVGVLGGWLSLHMARELKNSNSKVFSIDPWEKNWESGEVLDGNINRLGTGVQEGYTEEAYHFFKILRLHYESILKELDYKNVSIIQKPSLEAYKQFKDGDIDLIFIDGDHSTEHVTKELEIWFPKIKKGGVFSGDDFNDPRVKLAVKEFAKKNNFKIKTPRINRDIHGRLSRGNERYWELVK